MPYLMKKGSVSLIRVNEEGVKEAEKAGYSYIGPCDMDGKPVSGFDQEEKKPMKKTKKDE